VAQPVYANRAIGHPTPAAEPRSSSHPGPERRGSIRATPRPCSGSCGKLAEITRRVPRARGPDERHAGTKRRRGEPERRSSTVPNPSDPGCPAASVVVAGPTPPRWAVWREEPAPRPQGRSRRGLPCATRHTGPDPRTGALLPDEATARPTRVEGCRASVRPDPWHRVPESEPSPVAGIACAVSRETRHTSGGRGMRPKPRAGFHVKHARRGSRRRPASTPRCAAAHSERGAPRKR